MANIEFQGVSPAILARDYRKQLVVNPKGLRRWRALLGGGLYRIVPIYAVGDSLTFGQGGDDNTGSTNNIPDNTQGWVGQLRQRFTKVYGDTGEGYLFCLDSRSVITGALNGVSATEYSGPLKRAFRHQTGQKTVITVPATNAPAFVSVIQPNKSGDVSLTYQKNSSAQGNVVTLTGTGVPIVTDIAVVANDVIEVDGPASGNAYLAGWIFKSANTTGVRVHRLGQGGQVVGDMIGGTNNGSPKYTTSQQAQGIQSHYNFDGTGLVIVSFGVNDQAFQSGGGTTYQNNITPALYQTYLQQVCTQAVADGHCVLILGEPRSAAGLGTPGTEADYAAARYAVASTTDHVALVEISNWWGTDVTATQALGLTAVGSSHPKLVGHGDMARIVYDVLTAGDIAYQ